MKKASIKVRANTNHTSPNTSCQTIFLTRVQQMQKSNVYLVVNQFVLANFPFSFIEALRQERPPHLRGEHIHPAMIERGRAIPNTQSVPIINDKPQRSNDHVTIIDGRVSRFFSLSFQKWSRASFYLLRLYSIRICVLSMDVLYHDPYIFHTTICSSFIPATLAFNIKIKWHCNTFWQFITYICDVYENFYNFIRQ